MSFTFTIIIVMITAEPVIQPMSIIQYVNTTVTLSCKATTSSGIIRYQWRRVNGEITSDRANGVNTSTLTISSVTEQDEDEYYCVANYGPVNGILYNVTSNKANIIVYGEQWTLFGYVNNILQSVGPPIVRPISVRVGPVVQPISPVYYVMANTQLQLECHATKDRQSPNQLTFRWLKDSVVITNRDTKFTFASNILYIFTSNVYQHNGTYICRVNRVFSQSIAVIVESRFIHIIQGTIVYLLIYSSY